MVALALGASLLAPQGSGPSDARLVDVDATSVRVETSAYSLVVPKGWKVGTQTPWGARKIEPAAGGELGVMTAPPSNRSWDELMRISLGFILREEPGTPTKPVITRAKSGIEAASFEVLDAKGFAARRYVILKHPEKGLLALSVHIPNPEDAKQWERHFQRMVDSAVFKD